MPYITFLQTNPNIHIHIRNKEMIKKWLVLLGVNNPIFENDDSFIAENIYIPEGNQNSISRQTVTHTWLYTYFNKLT